MYFSPFTNRAHDFCERQGTNHLGKRLISSQLDNYVNDCIHTVSERRVLFFIPTPYDALRYASFFVKFTASVSSRVQRSPWKPGRAPRVYTVRRVLRVHACHACHARGAAQRGSFSSCAAKQPHPLFSKFVMWRRKGKQGAL